MTSPRKEAIKYWTEVCSKATDEELQEMRELHMKDPHRILEGPRGECIRDEISRRASRAANGKLEEIAKRIRGRHEH